MLPFALYAHAADLELALDASGILTGRGAPAGDPCGTRDAVGAAGDTVSLSAENVTPYRYVRCVARRAAPTGGLKLGGEAVRLADGDFPDALRVRLWDGELTAWRIGRAPIHVPDRGGDRDWGGLDALLKADATTPGPALVFARDDVKWVDLVGLVRRLHAAGRSEIVLAQASPPEVRGGRRAPEIQGALKRPDRVMLEAGGAITVVLGETPIDIAPDQWDGAVEYCDGTSCDQFVLVRGQDAWWIGRVPQDGDPTHRWLFGRPVLQSPEHVLQTTAPPEVAGRRDALGWFGDGIIAGEPTVLGGLPVEHVGKVLQKGLKEVRKCTASTPLPVPGKVTVRIVAGPDGRTQSATLRSSTLDNKELDACVAAALSGLKFAAPKGGGLVVVTAVIEVG
jgi:hypothetical protein